MTNSLRQQLQTAYPDAPYRQRRQKDILEEWQRESLSKPLSESLSRPIRHRPLAYALMVNVEQVGDDYYIASLAHRTGVCRGLAQDKDDAISRCLTLFNNR
jgi:hypothetical protein